MNAILRGTTRVIGELLITLGVVVLLFAAYEVYGKTAMINDHQHALDDQLSQAWGAPPLGGAPSPGPSASSGTSTGSGPATTRAWRPAPAGSCTRSSSPRWCRRTRSR